MAENPRTIVHVDAERGFSGGEAQVFALIRGLDAARWRNVLVCPPGSASEARSRELGLATRAVRMSNDFDLAAVWALRRAFIASGAALVHLHTARATWLGGWAAKWARIPALTTRRMDREVADSWRTRVIYRDLTLAVAAISPSVERALIAGGVPKERIRPIASAVDPRQLAPRRARDQVRAELGAAPHEVVVLTLGSLVRRKGLDVLLRAAADLGPRRARLKLWIAGEGPERAALEALAQELGLDTQTRFLGPRADVNELLAACEVFAMPSRREGLGVAALEAMAAGRPVLASRVGGLGEAVIDGRTGILVEPEDLASWTRAIARLVDDDALRARLGREGPERVKEGFLAEQMVASYDALYRELLGEPVLARASNRRADP